jgi:glyoxylase-like metal-dependent hydrolase (beta-lactamase superfamily II)
MLPIATPRAAQPRRPPFMSEPTHPPVEAFYDPQTGTLSYAVHDPATAACAIIDAVLDFDAKSGRTSTQSADRIIDHVRSQKLDVVWLLETHAHADHLSAARYLQQQLGGVIGIGESIRLVQDAFRGIYNLGTSCPADGSQFGRLFNAEDTFAIGNIVGRVLHVPGHTPADVAYVIDGQLAFVGDTLFMPDVGTARCDFPGGSALTLYQSIRRLLDLPATTRLFVCHDYPPAGRGPAWETTVAAQRTENIHVRDGINEADFVAMRMKRDATLAMPALMLPAIQVNIRAGELPPAEDNGVRYLKIPLNAL